VAPLLDGNFFVTWGGSDVYGRFFAPNGTALSNEFRINQQAGKASIPVCVLLRNGNLMVVWGELGGIYGRIVVYPNGTLLGTSEFIINQVAGGYQGSPSLAVGGITTADVNVDGNVFVAWTGDQTGTYRVYGRVLLQSNRSAVGDQFMVNQPEHNGGCSQIATLRNGNLFVTFLAQNATGVQYEYPYVMYGRMFSASGNAIGNDVLIDHNSLDPACPSTSVLENGNFVVVWIDYLIATDQTLIHGLIYSPEATPLYGGPFLISANVGGGPNPAVAGLIGGGFFAAWIGVSASGDLLNGVYGRYVASNGALLDEEIRLDLDLVGNQPVAVAGLLDGNVVVGWSTTSARVLFINATTEVPSPTATDNRIGATDNSAVVSTSPAVGTYGWFFSLAAVLLLR